MSNSYNLSIAPELAEIKGPTFNAGTDSLEHIRNEETLIEGSGFVSASNSLKEIWNDTEQMNNLISYLSRTGSNLNVNVQDVGVLNDIDAAGVTASSISALETIFPGTPTPDSPMEKMKNILVSAALETITYALSDTEIHGNDAEGSVDLGAYSKVKEILCPITGTLRIKFAMRSFDNTDTGKGKIYKNGIAHGTERIETTGIYVIYSEDLAFTQGDTIELWCFRFAAGKPCFYKDLKVCGNLQRQFENTLE